MKRIQVDLYGKRGHRQTEVTPQGFPTRHISTGIPSSEPPTITPELKTDTELQAEQVKAVMSAFNEAWRNNRDRLIKFLLQGFGNNLSAGSVLHALGNALETTYAPRTAMTPQMWAAFTADLQAKDYSSVDWIASLQTRIYRKYEDLRPRNRFTNNPKAI